MPDLAEKIVKIFSECSPAELRGIELLSGPLSQLLTASGDPKLAALGGLLIPLLEIRKEFCRRRARKGVRKATG